MDRNKLIKSRRKIDDIDNRIFSLIKKRTKIVKTFLKIKDNKKQIVDKKRIKEILSKIKKKSIKHKVDATVTNRIWKEIIWSYVDFQKRKFKKK